MALVGEKYQKRHLCSPTLIPNKAIDDIYIQRRLLEIILYRNFYIIILRFSILKNNLLINLYDKIRIKKYNKLMQ